MCTLFGCEFLFLKSTPPQLPPGPRGGILWGKGGYFGGSCVVTTYLELLSSNLVFNSHLGADLIFWSQIPPSSRGVPPGGLCFWGRWVLGTFLKVLCSNLVWEPYLGANFNFWTVLWRAPNFVLSPLRLSGVKKGTFSTPESTPEYSGVYFYSRWNMYIVICISVKT